MPDLSPDEGAAVAAIVMAYVRQHADPDDDQQWLKNRTAAARSALVKLGLTAAEEDGTIQP